MGQESVEDVLEFIDAETGELSAVRVVNIDAIWPGREGQLDADGNEVPAATQAIISTEHSLCYSRDDAATLITRWKRQLGRVLAR